MSLPAAVVADTIMRTVESEPTSLPAAVVADTIMRTVELGAKFTDAAVDGDATVVFCDLLDYGQRHSPAAGVKACTATR